MEPVTVTLTTPVKGFGGRSLESLTIAREMNGKDMLAIEGMGENRATLTLIARLFVDADGKPIAFESVESMTRRDIAALERAMLPFAGVGPAT
jgi:hypothetical protein